MSKRKITTCVQPTFIKYQNTREKELLIKRKAYKIRLVEQNKQIDLNIENRNATFWFILTNIGVFLFDINTMLLISSLCRDIRNKIQTTINMRLNNDVSFDRGMKYYLHCACIDSLYLATNYESSLTKINTFVKEQLIGDHHIIDTTIFRHIDETTTMCDYSLDDKIRIMRKILYIRYLNNNRKFFAFKKRLTTDYDDEDDDDYGYMGNYCYDEYDEIDNHTCVSMVEGFRNGTIVNIEYTTYTYFKKYDNKNFIVCPDAKEIKNQNERKYRSKYLHKSLRRNQKLVR